MDSQQLPQPNFNQPQGQPVNGPFGPNNEPQPQHGNPPMPQPWQPGQQLTPAQFAEPPREPQQSPDAYIPPQGWTVPQPPAKVEPPRPAQQFGGQMPELPQLAGESNITPSSIYQAPQQAPAQPQQMPPQPEFQQRPQPQFMQAPQPMSPVRPTTPLAPPVQPLASAPSRAASSKRMLITIPLLLLIMLGIFWGAYSLVSHFTHKSAQPTSKTTTVSVTQSSISDANKQLAAMGKSSQLSAADVSKLDKTSAFFATFENANKQAKVGTISDVYYTDKQTAARPQQYTLYQASTNYAGKDKIYAFAQDTYGSLSVSRQRCQNGNLYTYSADGSGKMAWVKSGSNSACKLGSIKANINDGFSAGDMNDAQAQKFVDALVASRAVSVDDVKTVTVGGKQYLRFDVLVKAQWQNKQSVGMQVFGDAFNKTGLDAANYPYAYFGTGAQGAKIAYYVDAATQLPVYSQAVTTTAVNDKGDAVVTQSYEHQAVEYTYGDKGIVASPDAAIAFQNWPAY